MTNTALSLLCNDEVREYNKEIDLIFQHNDPNLLRYKHNSQESSRKPDSIFMTTSAARTLHGVPPEAEWIEFAKKWATPSPKRSGEETLNWGDALSSVEYKRHNAQVVDLKEATMPEANSFVDVLKSEHILEPRKRKISVNKTEDGNTISAPALVMTDWTKFVAIQSGEYALNRLCCSFDITHTFTFILIDTTLYVSWYDHEGISTTEGFDVAKYLSH